MYPDPFDLARFEHAQNNGVYESSVKELKAGLKTVVVKYFWPRFYRFSSTLFPYR